MEPRARRPSAALVLGILSGAIAALTILPTAIPLTWRITTAEQALSLRHASVAASVAAELLAHDDLSAGASANVQVDSLFVTSPDGETLFLEGPMLPEEATAEACTVTTAVTWIDANDQVWMVSCLDAPKGRVVAAFVPSFQPTWQLGGLIFLLAVIVGIITALGVLRLLSPLSQVATALERVEAGERGVRVVGSGMAELDDLAERLNAAAQAMETREDAILSRIQVVQEMARLVAHEVRNPLQSLELLTSLIAQEDDPDERREIARSIRNEILALDAVVHRLLREGAARGGLRLQRSWQSISPIIEHVTSVSRAEANARGIRLHVASMSERPVPIDPALMGRSIENLVVNAIQAVDRNGTVRVAVVEEYPWLCIEVEDDGPGVDPAVGEHIFEPNVSNKAEGTGLGLALVKGVIEAHDGYIEHTPSELGGAKFIARIPLHVEGGEVSGNPEGTPAQSTRRRRQSFGG